MFAPKVDYPKAVGAILGQDGFNWFWIGIVTLNYSASVLKGNADPIFLSAFTEDLTDLGVSYS